MFIFYCLFPCDNETRDTLCYGEIILFRRSPLTKAYILKNNRLGDTDVFVHIYFAEKKVNFEFSSNFFFANLVLWMK